MSGPRFLGVETPLCLCREAVGARSCYQLRWYRGPQCGDTGIDPALANVCYAAPCETDIELIRVAAGLAQSGEVVYADANCRWTLHDALKVVRAVDDLDVMIEQPCLTYEACLHVRAHQPVDET